MSTPEVSNEHLQRAHAQMRCEKPDMPPLDVLRSHWVLYSCVRNRALGIARGDVMPPAPCPVTVPAAAKPVQTPAPHHHRRRDDGGIDHKLAASGEYARHDTE